MWNTPVIKRAMQRVRDFRPLDSRKWHTCDCGNKFTLEITDGIVTSENGFTSKDGSLVCSQCINKE